MIAAIRICPVCRANGKKSLVCGSLDEREFSFSGVCMTCDTIIIGNAIPLIICKKE